jgi:hypothetical protein
MFVINNEYEAENVLAFMEKNNIAKMRGAQFVKPHSVINYFSNI